MNYAEAHRIVAAAAGRRTTPAIAALEWVLNQLDKAHLELVEADREITDLENGAKELDDEIDYLWEVIHSFQ